MAELPVLPLYTDAYLGDTQHLTLEEHGAYTRLLMIHWRMMPQHLPDDDARIARMLGITPRRWRGMKPTICDGKLYAIRDGFFRQKRLENEWRDALESKAKKRGAAKVRWGSKSLPENETAHADAYAEHDAGADAEDVQGICPPSPSPSKRVEVASKPKPPPRAHAREAPAGEQQDRAAKWGVHALGDQICDIVGIDQARWDGTYRPVQAWLDAGYDPERDILPAIEDKVRRKRVAEPDWAPHTLAFFDGAIRDWAKRQMPDIPPNLDRRRNGAGHDAQPEPPKAPHTRAMLLASRRDDRAFINRLGPLVAEDRWDEANAMANEYLAEHGSAA